MSMIPCVIEQTSRGERSYDIFSRLLSDRILFLGEEVTELAASTIIAQMLFLEAQDPEGYFVCEKDPAGFEQFEAAFPKKEKLQLPGQFV